MWMTDDGYRQNDVVSQNQIFLKALRHHENKARRHLEQNMCIIIMVFVVDHLELRASFRMDGLLTIYSIFPVCSANWIVSM